MFDRLLNTSLSSAIFLSQYPTEGTAVTVFLFCFLFVFSKYLIDIGRHLIEKIFKHFYVKIHKILASRQFSFLISVYPFCVNSFSLSSIKHIRKRRTRCLELHNIKQKISFTLFLQLLLQEYGIFFQSFFESMFFISKNFCSQGPSITYANFSEKLTFLNPRIRGVEMLVFRKILRKYLMDDPLIITENHRLSCFMYSV